MADESAFDTFSKYLLLASVGYGIYWAVTHDREIAEFMQLTPSVPDRPSPHIRSSEDLPQMSNDSRIDARFMKKVRRIFPGVKINFEKTPLGVYAFANGSKKFDDDRDWDAIQDQLDRAAESVGLHVREENRGEIFFEER